MKIVNKNISRDLMAYKGSFDEKSPIIFYTSVFRFDETLI